jgi:hypothetical protein
MSRLHRRELLGVLSALCGVAVGGCVGESGGTPRAGTASPVGTASTDCDAADVPNPTSAAADPREYPDRPERLTRERVRTFVSAYERAFQYNRRLADDPDKLGRLNSLSVHVGETRVETDTDTDHQRFVVDVSGQVSTGIRDVDSTGATPATPTVTPLPMGHRPFETQYVVTERFLCRDGVVVACW